MKAAVNTCPGPLIWYAVSMPAPRPAAAVLECAGCRYVVVSGGFNDPAHAATPILREGLAA